MVMGNLASTILSIAIKHGNGFIRDTANFAVWVYVLMYIIYLLLYNNKIFMQRH
jgi:hypothetical protein